ncbi:MAG: hypothetical protein Q8Q10_02705 [bacterium]|nr:hypothetical protein [bacterium]
MNKFLLTAAALAFASVANAQSVAQTFQNKEGEIVFVESRDNNKAFPAVVAVIEKAGYSRRTTSDIPPGTKTDTWCKVDVYRERQILGECYTPQMGHSLSVRNHVTTSTGDYSQVPTMVAQIRDEHRRASAFLGIK